MVNQQDYPFTRMLLDDLEAMIRIHGERDAEGRVLIAKLGLMAGQLAPELREVLLLCKGYSELREALMDTTAHLVAAVYLLERGGKKAAPSDRMFAQMLNDYNASIARGRVALLAEKK